MNNTHEVKKIKNTTIAISHLAKLRLTSILRKSETFAFGLDLLLLNFTKPKVGDSSGYGNRTVNPPFSDEEIFKIQEGFYEFPEDETISKEPLKSDFKKMQISLEE